MNYKTLCISALITSICLPAFAADIASNIAEKHNFKQCLSTVTELEKFFADPIGGEDYGVYVSTAKKDTSRNPLHATLELDLGTSSQIIDLVVAPTIDGGCAYSYTRTFYIAASCRTVSKDTSMSKTKFQDALFKRVFRFADSTGSNMYLMPAGEGCILQKQEMVFG